MAFIRPGRSAAPPPPPSGDVTPSLIVEYVDTSGDRQTTTVVSGVTSITGVAPFMVSFDASESRATTASTDHEAWNELGYELTYGDAVAGNWPVSGQPKSRDRGQPSWGWAYETAGTYTATCKVRDALGNQSQVTCQVVVTSPAAATNLPVSNGSWGTLASGSHYSIDRGSDYTAWGSPPTDGLHGVLISATGSGAAPIIAGWNTDGRNNQSGSITRTRNCRTLNVDVANMSAGNVGYDYCGVINGRLRTYTDPAVSYGFGVAVELSWGAPTANNCRYPRGLFLWNCGELNNDGSGYALFGQARAMHIVGVTLNKNSGSGGSHCMRGVFDRSSMRHCLLTNTISSSSFTKIQGSSCKLPGNPLVDVPDAWRSDDRAGDYAASTLGTTDEYLKKTYGYATSRFAIQRNQHGDASSTTPNANAGFGPQNNLGPDSANPPEGVELSSYEDCTWYAAVPNDIGISLDSIENRGRGLGATNNKCNLGAGADVPYGENNQVNRVPTGWQGPYYSNYTRPVPV